MAENAARNAKVSQSEEEVGGFNPERRREKPKEQVGPAPTADPDNKAGPSLKQRLASIFGRLQK